MEKKLKCKKCNHKWTYKGKKGGKPYIEYTQCPRCRYNVKLEI